jgi:chromosome segregation ATPase
MGALSKIFAVSFAVALAGACGGGESGPRPLERRFDEIHVAKFTLEQKGAIVKAQNDWQVARMENAQAEAQLGEIANQLPIVKNEHKAAKLSLESAQATKKAADASADTNRINTATQELRTAELALKAAESRLKYFEAVREHAQRKQAHTAENMYWREAQFELAKAQLAQQNSIAPKGVQFDWYPKQEADRAKRTASARDRAESSRQRAQGARESWLKAQQTADQASGKPSSLPDPMAPAVQSTLGSAAAS